MISMFSGIYGIEKSPKSARKAMKKIPKWRLGVVLGTLGGAPGGIWSPTGAKAEKRLEKKTPFSKKNDTPQGPSGEPKF